LEDYLVKRIMTFVCITTFSFALLAGCSEDTPKTETNKPSAQAAPAVPSAPAAPASAPSKSGKVVETMDAAGYTYVQVDTGAEKIWAAAPQFAVKVGDDVIVPEGMPMPNYHSKTLERDFDVVSGRQPPTSSGAPVVEKTTLDLSGITVVEGGQSVADIYSKQDELVGKPVKVRGKVVKYNGGIMGKNWLHVQDGTGENGSNDLPVTTKDTVKVGDTVVISGVLVKDRDFGYGYAYSVLVEDADVKVE
jgi:hypothetical protein